MSKILTFQYHTFLHHSQTLVINARHNIEFQYHTFLHHSQTTPYDVCEVMCFSTIHFYIILKRNEQGTACRIVSVPYIFTSFSNGNHCKTWEIRVSVPYIFTSFSNLRHPVRLFHMFQYHTFLHHSQTSNSKTNRHHLRKTRYSNTFNRFHIDLYL